MKKNLCLIALALILLNACTSTKQTATWQTALETMPLSTKVQELNRSNCVQVMLTSFGSNDTVKAIVFMPGATDEFYMFRRAKATLTTPFPTLLDAVIALTNQTYIQATFRNHFLLLHTTEDPLKPLITVQDQPTVSKLKSRLFEEHSLYYDKDWDYLLPPLGKSLKVALSPGMYARESFHFYRHSFAGWNLNGWEAAKAVALAGKTTITVSTNWLIFQPDSRVAGPIPDANNIKIK